MKITKRQLRRIIKEELGILLKESAGGTLHVKGAHFGMGMDVENDKGEYMPVGQMVRSLLDKGVSDFFKDGVDQEKALRNLERGEERVRGMGEPPLERWDSEVFSDYYDVDLRSVVEKFAEQEGMQVNYIEPEEESDEDGYWGD